MVRVACATSLWIMTGDVHCRLFLCRLGFGTGTALYGKDTENMIVAAIKAGFTHLDGTTVLLPSPQPTIQYISSHPTHPHLSSRPSLRERRLPRRRHSRLGRPALPTLHHYQIPRTRPGPVSQITPAGPAQEAQGRLR